MNHVSSMERDTMMELSPVQAITYRELPIWLRRVSNLMVVVTSMAHFVAVPVTLLTSDVDELPKKLKLLVVLALLVAVFCWFGSGTAPLNRRSTQRMELIGIMLVVAAAWFMAGQILDQSTSENAGTSFCGPEPSYIEDPWCGAELQPQDWYRQPVPEPEYRFDYEVPVVPSSVPTEVVPT